MKRVYTTINKNPIFNTNINLNLSDTKYDKLLLLFDKMLSITTFDDNTENIIDDEDERSLFTNNKSMKYKCYYKGNNLDIYKKIFNMLNIIRPYDFFDMSYIIDTSVENSYYLDSNLAIIENQFTSNKQYRYKENLYTNNSQYGEFISNSIHIADIYSECNRINVSRKYSEFKLYANHNDYDSPRINNKPRWDGINHNGGILNSPKFTEFINLFIDNIDNIDVCIEQTPYNDVFKENDHLLFAYTTTNIAYIKINSIIFFISLNIIKNNLDNKNLLYKFIKFFIKNITRFKYSYILHDMVHFIIGFINLYYGVDKHHSINLLLNKLFMVLSEYRTYFYQPSYADPPTTFFTYAPYTRSIILEYILNNTDNDISNRILYALSLISLSYHNNGLRNKNINISSFTYHFIFNNDFITYKMADSKYLNTTKIIIDCYIDYIKIIYQLKRNVKDNVVNLLISLGGFINPKINSPKRIQIVEKYLSKRLFYYIDYINSYIDNDNQLYDNKIIKSIFSIIDYYIFAYRRNFNISFMDNIIILLEFIFNKVYKRKDVYNYIINLILINANINIDTISDDMYTSYAFINDTIDKITKVRVNLKSYILSNKDYKQTIIFMNKNFIKILKTYILMHNNGF